ncbi:MAG: glycoside hydrolase family 43 protein, partial [Duncaniella sp.]|nr:glycoside hydrolase family 43 protein [Duncaniella sp.]
LSQGMLLVKNEQRQLFLAIRKGEVSLIQIGKGKNNVLATQKLKTDGSPIGLRTVSDGDTYSFYYRPSGSEWTPLVENVDAEYIATQRGGFTGSTIGVYATSDKNLMPL